MDRQGSERVVRQPSLAGALVGDGRPALGLTAVALFVSGAFAVFLSFRREFLPHDVAFLGMTAEQLCAMADCRVVRFMFHDRVAFGGTLMSIAILYLWLMAFPLRNGERWAWRTFLVTGTFGFGSFLAYLGYGYFDTWHGAGTVALLPVFVTGLLATRPFCTRDVSPWLWSEQAKRAPRWLRLGRWGWLATGAGLALAGGVILAIGMTEVFVAEDLGFIGVTREALDHANMRLVPLIAHDRAGFGGGLATTGLLVALCSWYAPPSRAFHEAIIAAGAVGFGAAIGTHFAEGYLNPVHLAPAFAGLVLFTASAASQLLAARDR